MLASRFVSCLIAPLIIKCATSLEPDPYLLVPMAQILTSGCFGTWCHYPDTPSAISSTHDAGTSTRTPVKGGPIDLPSSLSSLAQVAEGKSNTGLRTGSSLTTLPHLSSANAAPDDSKSRASTPSFKSALQTDSYKSLPFLGDTTARDSTSTDLGRLVSSNLVAISSALGS